MQESYSNKELTYHKDEIFSQLQIPDTPFFVRLDGRRFKAVSEKIGAEKPFDKRLAKCLTASAKAIFQNNFSPTLIYVASDEINMLFLYNAPFRRRVEKTDSILAGVVSSTVSLNIIKFFEKSLSTSFDSSIIPSSKEKIIGYLVWRQRDAWRNHNNSYAYWLFRKKGHKSSEVAKMLRRLKTKDIHETLFRHGINLAETPPWQRRGILIYREPYQKQVEDKQVTRWRITENWNLPLFSSKEGQALTQKILEWTNPVRGDEVVRISPTKNR
jgi:tRNA(His) 5'-end guanylyltransferase